MNDVINHTQEMNLSQRIYEPMSAPEFLRNATNLAAALRYLHDRSVTFGELDPSKVTLTETEAKLTRGLEPSAGITPYTAPEQVAGKPADVRSDIFAFGAVVYEMLSGRKAFEAHSQEELRTAILEREPAPLDNVSPELSRLVARCLAKSPESRWQRMQKVQMELKLLTATSRHAEESAARRDRLETSLRATVEELENRLSARLASQDANFNGLQRGLAEHGEKIQGASQVENSLRAEIAAVENRLAERLSSHDANFTGLHQGLAEQGEKLQSAGQVESSLRGEIAALESKLSERMASQDASLTGHHQRISEHSEKLQGAGQLESSLRAEIIALDKQLSARMEGTEGRIAELADESRGHEARSASINQALAVLRESISKELHQVQETLKAQANSLESLATAGSQTDDLIEHLVEAFSLQRSVLERNDATRVSAGSND